MQANQEKRRQKEMKNQKRPQFILFSQPPQQEAFLLIRDFAHLANGKDFQVGLYTLAARLSLTPPGAACVIERLRDLAAIDKVADAQINRRSALYRWIANRDELPMPGL